MSGRTHKPERKNCVTLIALIARYASAHVILPREQVEGAIAG